MTENFNVILEPFNRPSLDVESLMRKRLPAYIVNCLLAAGYDSADVICSMDTTGPRNSIEVIEEFIENYFHGQRSIIATQC